MARFYPFRGNFAAISDQLRDSRASIAVSEGASAGRRALTVSAAEDCQEEEEKCHVRELLDPISGGSREFRCGPAMHARGY
jgi:hypothetical protein